jgi:hypothetical protein
MFAPFLPTHQVLYQQIGVKANNNIRVSSGYWGDRQVSSCTYTIINKKNLLKNYSLENNKRSLISQACCLDLPLTCRIQKKCAHPKLRSGHLKRAAINFDNRLGSAGLLRTINGVLTHPPQEILLVNSFGIAR